MKQGEKKRRIEKVFLLLFQHLVNCFASYISKHLGTLITFCNTKLFKFPLSLPLRNLSVFFLETLIFLNGVNSTVEYIVYKYIGIGKA